MDLSDKEITIASGNFGVCNMDHVLWEKAVRSGGWEGRDGGEGHLAWSHLTAKHTSVEC